MAFMTFHILGMSSSQLTNIFQRGRYTTNHSSAKGHIMSDLQMCKTTSNALERYLLSKLQSVGSKQSKHSQILPENCPGMDSLSAVEFRNRFTGKMPGL